MRFQSKLQENLHIDYCNGTLHKKTKATICQELVEAFPQYNEFPFSTKTTKKSSIEIIKQILYGNCYRPIGCPHINGLLRFAGSEMVIVINWTYTSNYLVFGSKGFKNVQIVSDYPQNE